jgi:hypothetical protein
VSLFLSPITRKAIIFDCLWLLEVLWNFHKLKSTHSFGCYPQILDAQGREKANLSLGGKDNNGGNSLAWVNVHGSYGNNLTWPRACGHCPESST